MAQTALELLVSQIDEKIEQLKEYISVGRADNYEEYKRVCGEIKGLLTARGYTLDLQQRLESSDE